MDVTVIRPLGTDKYGDPIEGDAPEHDLDGAVIAPGATSDVTDRGRNGAAIALTLYAPVDADIERTDKVRYLDEVYDVIGGIDRFESPYGSAVEGIVVALGRGEG